MASHTLPLSQHLYPRLPFDFHLALAWALAATTGFKLVTNSQQCCFASILRFKVRPLKMLLTATHFQQTRTYPLWISFAALSTVQHDILHLSRIS